MKPLTIKDAETVILGLQDEIRRSGEARYDHRLHGVLLVAQGLSCPQVAHLLGDAPRTVEYWVQRFEKEGLSGLVGGRASRSTDAFERSAVGGDRCRPSRAPNGGGTENEPVGRKDLVGVYPRAL